MLRGQHAEIDARLLSYNLSDELSKNEAHVRIMDSKKDTHAETSIGGFTIAVEPKELIYVYDASANVSALYELKITATNQNGRTTKLPVRNGRFQAPDEGGTYHLSIHQEFGAHGSFYYEGQVIVTTDRLTRATIAVDALYSNTVPLEKIYGGARSDYQRAEALIEPLVLMIEDEGEISLIPLFESIHKLPEDTLGAAAMVSLFSRISGLDETDWSTVSDWLEANDAEARRIYEDVKARH